MKLGALVEGREHCRPTALRSSPAASVRLRALSRVFLSCFKPQRTQRPVRDIFVTDFRLRRGANVSALRAGSTGEGGKLGIVIVDHGSKRKESNEQLESFVELFRGAHPDATVLAAHMELAEPSIKQAVQQCAEIGCSRVVVAPYFLSQGRHIQQDIPALVAEAQAAFPNLECIVADPIGLDAAVVGIINDRVQSALQCL